MMTEAILTCMCVSPQLNQCFVGGGVPGPGDTGESRRDVSPRGERFPGPRAEYIVYTQTVPHQSLTGSTAIRRGTECVLVCESS